MQILLFSKNKELILNADDGKKTLDPEKPWKYQFRACTSQLYLVAYFHYFHIILCLLENVYSSSDALDVLQHII